jgi:hypothetical protein
MTSPSQPYNDLEGLWWRHERLHRSVLRNPAQLLPLFADERDRLERRWVADPPDPSKAFAAADRALDEWAARVTATPVVDVRPMWARHYWKVRNRRADI